MDRQPEECSRLQRFRGSLNVSILEDAITGYSSLMNDEEVIKNQDPAHAPLS